MCYHLVKRTAAWLQFFRLQVVGFFVDAVTAVLAVFYLESGPGGSGSSYKL